MTANSNDNNSTPLYTCNEYREEMILVGLKQRLQKTDLSDDERKKLIKEISHLEKLIGF